VLFTSSGGSTPLILEYPILQMAWQPLIFICFLHFFSFFLPFLSATSLHSSCHCVFFFLCAFHFHSSSSKSPYNCVFSLPYRSEPSHLLNHSIKFVYSGNLLWVSHHILLKTKTHKQSTTHKMYNLKINSHQTLYIH